MQGDRLGRPRSTQAWNVYWGQLCVTVRRRASDTAFHALRGMRLKVKGILEKWQIYITTTIQIQR